MPLLSNGIAGGRTQRISDGFASLCQRPRQVLRAELSAHRPARLSAAGTARLFEDRALFSGAAEARSDEVR